MIEAGKFNRIVYAGGMTIEVANIDGKYAITLDHPRFTSPCPYFGVGTLSEFLSFLGGDIQGFYDTDPNMPGYVRVARGTYGGRDGKFRHKELVVAITLRNEKTGEAWEHVMNNADAKALHDCIIGKSRMPEEGMMIYKISTG